MATNYWRMQVHTMGADMTETWKQWEGRTVDGKFVLESYLGGSNESATFRTRVDDEPAAIKVTLLNADEGERQLRQWKAAKALNHPNLQRVLAAGSEVAEAGQQLVYVVQEFADENLGQILPERPLTTEETRGMLGSVLAALGYVYDKGLVHGGIRPSNILAVGEQVKLSSDSVRPVGEPLRVASIYDAPEAGASGASKAADVWALGMTVVEVLTRHVPAWDAARMTAPPINPDVIEPFRTIARRCLELDPGKRCGLREIRDRLELGTAYEKPSLLKRESMRHAIPAETASHRWLYGVVAAAVLGVVVFLFLRPRSESGSPIAPAQPDSSRSAPTTSASPSSSAAASNEGAENTPAPATTETGAKSEPPSSRSTREASSNNEIVERVMPQVAPSARRTITGTVKVRVKVNVDADGNVTGASLTNPGPSKYFARLALEAARKWKFAPTADKSEATRVWNLVFGFTRSRTESSASRAQ
jgi:TonB family protein